MAAQADPEIPGEGEWMLVEIFGHRSHWGLGREVERFGAKMLRIDGPTVEWQTPTAEQPRPEPVVTGWVSHLYGGAAIFSQTLTDERTALLRNAPYVRPAAYLAPPEAAAEPADPDGGGLDGWDDEGPF